MALVAVDTGSNSVADSSESRALVLALPEEWPRLKGIDAIQYLHCTGVTHTSVNKAQCHLELLQNAIEEWFARRSNTRLQSTEPQLTKVHSVIKEISTLSDRLSTKTDEKMMVLGISPKPTYHYYSDDPGVPYLGADDVVNEVVTLLAKLECDRRDTEAAIRAERNRVIQLADRIDKLSEAKLVQIPSAVQAEHEACIEDIAELQWHVQGKKKALVKSRRRHEKSERLNNEIKKEIKFIKEHDPLVREKLKMELSKIHLIKDENLDSMHELEATLNSLAQTEKKNKEAHRLADLERAKLQQEIDKATANRDKACKAVEQAKDQFVELGKRIEACKEKILKETQEIEVMEVKNANEYEKQKMLQTTVDELLRTLRHDEYQVKLVDQEKYETEQLEDRTRATQQTQRAEIRQGVNHTEDKYIFMRREADEEQAEVEQMENKIKECEIQKKDDERNLERMTKELERTNEELDKLMDDFTRVAKEHSDVTKALENDEKKVVFVEDSLKATIQQLMRQIDDEINTRDSLLMRIETDTKELGHQKKESKVKRAKLRKMGEEMKTAVELMTKKVELLRAEAAEKKAFADKLDKELSQLTADKNATESRLDARIGDLRPKQLKVKEDLANIGKQLTDLGWQIDMMNKKIKDIFDQSGMINKSKIKFSDAITILQDQLKKLEIELTSRTRKEDALTYRVGGIQARLKDKEDLHRRLLQERQEVERDLQEKYRKALISNKKLASQYRTMQNEVFSFRDQLLTLLHEKLVYEDAMKDCKQVCRLQSRLHAALNAYLRYKKGYTELRMEDMQIRGKKNIKVTGALQDQIESSLEHISNFLNSQMDVLMHGQRVAQSS